MSRHTKRHRSPDTEPSPMSRDITHLRHRWGASSGWESCCFSLPEGAPSVTVVAYGVVWMHCTRGGCYWTRVGCTLGRWGLRAVRTTLGQWIPTLVEQADSRQSRRRVIASRPSAQAASRGRWGRTCDGRAGPCRKDPGLAPARPGVHSADINGPCVKAPSGDRWNSAVLFRCAAPVRL